MTLMKQAKLIYDSADDLSFNLNWIRPLVDPVFDLEPYDDLKTYDKASCVVLASYVGIKTLDWAKQMLLDGYKVIIDHLWDSDVDTPSLIRDNTLVLRNANWIWYTSCLEWRQLGYDLYQPQKEITHSFFMPMNRHEWHRDLIMKSLSTVLPTAIYSYVAKDIHLPNDIQEGEHTAWRSYFNPEWYDHSCFSVVAESFMRTDAWYINPGLYDNYKTEISEKSFKPMMGRVPFVIFGSVHTLRYLRNQGFADFDNLFDQSYDNIVSDYLRHQATTQVVIDAVERWKNGEQFLDAETRKRCQHNHARLFDQNLVKKKYNDEIINTVLEFVN
jgi:hypothetical protein